MHSFLLDESCSEHYNLRHCERRDSVRRSFSEGVSNPPPTCGQHQVVVSQIRLLSAANFCVFFPFAPWRETLLFLIKKRWYEYHLDEISFNYNSYCFTSFTVDFLSPCLNSATYTPAL